MATKNKTLLRAAHERYRNKIRLAAIAGMCSKCGKRKARWGFKRCHACRRRHYGYHCKYQRNGKFKTAEFLNKVRIRSKAKRMKWRLAVIQMYGGKCACCGESAHEFLTVDHKNGDGAKHRKKLGVRRGATSGTFYPRLLKEGVRADIQLLCANCHMAKDMFGGCPHQKPVPNVFISCGAP